MYIGGGYTSIRFSKSAFITFKEINAIFNISPKSLRRLFSVLGFTVILFRNEILCDPTINIRQFDVLHQCTSSPNGVMAFISSS